jgi:hypothetical protein
MGTQHAIRVQHALTRLERLVIAREAAETVWKASGEQAEFFRWRLLVRKAARQHAKIARAFQKIV